MTHTPGPLTSDKGEKYAALAAHIRVGKASQDDAAKAILELIADNERLAVIIGKWRAKADAIPEIVDALQDLLWALDNAAAILSAHGLESTIADPRPRARAAIAKARGQA